MNGIKSSQRGIGLIEVMVSFFILGFGLLSLAMFSNEMFSETSSHKAKTEALQLAQKKLDLFRQYALVNGNDLLKSDYNEQLIDGESDEHIYEGVNALFSLSDTEVTGSEAPYTVMAKVTWQDPSKQGEDKTNSVELFSYIDEPDAASLAQLASGGGIAMDKERVGPGGSAEYADGTYTPKEAEQPISTDAETGYKVYKEGDKYVLVDPNNTKVLQSDHEFFRIQGTVYSDGRASLPIDELVVITSDVGVCKTIDQPSFETGSGNTKRTYTVIDYYCYVGYGWYGNIGLGALYGGDGQASAGSDGLYDSIANGNTSNIGTNDEVCVGDPSQTDSGEPDSRHPQLTWARLYMAEGGEGITQQAQLGTYHHDFLLTKINGNATDDDCTTIMATAVQSISSVFLDNYGSYVDLCDGERCSVSTAPKLIVTLTNNSSQPKIVSYRLSSNSDCGGSVTLPSCGGEQTLQCDLSDADAGATLEFGSGVSGTNNSQNFSNVVLPSDIADGVTESRTSGGDMNASYNLLFNVTGSDGTTYSDAVTVSLNGSPLPCTGENSALSCSVTPSASVGPITVTDSNDDSISGSLENSSKICTNDDYNSRRTVTLSGTSTAPNEISGTVTLATGGDAPNQTSINDVSVTVVGGECSSTVSGSTYSYSCEVPAGWGGSINIAPTGVKACQQSGTYNYVLKKSSKSC